jgi:hypothetical protein
MLKAAFSSFARDFKTKDALERFALPEGRAADAVQGALKRLSAPLRGAIPVSLRGLPDGIRQDEVEDVCRRHFGERPIRTAYVHLTGWKTSWVHRIFVRCESGKRLSLVFKNAVYNDEHVPAVRDLPVTPGPPEHTVYRALLEKPAEPLARLLPKTYLAEEIEPGRHYRYLLEDLGSRFVRLERRQATLRIASLLPVVHKALRSVDIDPNRLLKYDRSFRAGLLEYARTAVTRYSDLVGSKAADDLLASWEAVEAAYPAEIPDTDQFEGPIHGDPNITNVLFCGGESRFIDWEWAGLGLPHVDLAAVVKGAPPELEEESLRTFVREHGGAGEDEHRRLYLICKVERGLIDGAFLAIQAMDAAGQAGFDIDGPLRRALATARLINN